jgi:two-component system, sensor histidine kinase
MHPTHSPSLTVPEAAHAAHVGPNGSDVRQAIGDDDIVVGDTDVGKLSPDAVRVTQDQRFTRRLSSRIEELLLAERRKDEFLAMLSHELRSPLTAIRHALGVLRMQSGEDVLVRDKMHELIERQVRHMGLLTAGLTDISRISRGHLRLQRERVDLRVVIGNAIETLESELKQRSQRLTSTWPDSPVWLHADASRLEQVFVNLIGNASKYTDAGGELASWMHTLGGHAFVRIRDSGIGIAPEALPHIFDLFMQADATAPRSRSGLGIGLALVRTLVELHGGSVTAASRGLGQGSEFTVRLPEDN